MEGEAMSRPRIDWQQLQQSAARVQQLTQKIAEAARRVTRRAHASAGLLERIAADLGARGHSRDLAAELRLEAEKLRKSADAARKLLG
jgi:hypothetical protein